MGQRIEIPEFQFFHEGPKKIFSGSLKEGLDSGVYF